jgi:hypothetical protein
MKPRIAIIILAAIIAAACSDIEPEGAVLTIKLETDDMTTDTKLMGSRYGNETLAKNIKGLDILVFNYSTKALEKHVRIADAWNRSTGLPVSAKITRTSFSVNIPEGKKDVLVIANSQHTAEQLDDYYNGSSSVLYSDLAYEFPELFTMYGFKSGVTISGNTSTSVSLSRIVARIVVNQIRNSTSSDMDYFKLTFSNCCGYTAITKSGTLQGDTRNLWNNQTVSGHSDAVFKSQKDASETSFVTSNQLYQFPSALIYRGSTYTNKIYFFMYPRSSSTSQVNLNIECGVAYDICRYNITFRTIAANTSYNINSLVVSSSGSNQSISSAGPTKAGEDGWNNCDLGDIVL